MDFLFSILIIVAIFALAVGIYKDFKAIKRSKEASEQFTDFLKSKALSCQKALPQSPTFSQEDSITLNCIHQELKNLVNTLERQNKPHACSCNENAQKEDFTISLDEEKEEDLENDIIEDMLDKVHERLYVILSNIDKDDLEEKEIVVEVSIK